MFLTVARALIAAYYPFGYKLYVPIDLEQSGWLKFSPVANSNMEFPTNRTRRLSLAGFRLINLFLQLFRILTSANNRGVPAPN